MTKFKIGHRYIGDGEPCYIVLECGATYDGIENAKEIIKAAAESGADAIKFQVIDADRLMGDKTLTINYETYHGKRTSNLYEILKKRSLTREQWKEIKNYCDEQQITFFSTATFPEEVDFLVEIGSAAIKINAGDVNHYYLIDYASKKNIPIILDGRAKYDELEKGVNICENNGNHSIVVMHCPSGYPAKNTAVNLNVIPVLKNIYRYPIGFSDHSREKLMNYGALFFGADMLEKTITLDKKTDSIEHIMSLEPHEAKQFVEEIRALEEAKGSSRIMFSKKVGQLARRSITIKRNIKKGEILGINDIDFKRPGDAGISCSEYENILGKEVLEDIKCDAFVQKSQLKD